MVEFATAAGTYSIGAAIASFIMFSMPVVSSAAAGGVGPTSVVIGHTSLAGTAEHGVARFSGIRYAVAPAGRLRWRPPVAFMLPAGPYDARKPGAAGDGALGSPFGR